LKHKAKETEYKTL